MRNLIFLALLSASLSCALQFPFDVNYLWWNRLQPLPSPATAEPRSPRIAIIGAGAGGSSAAFWISKAKERYGLDVAIDVYESNDYIGGRSTTVYPYNDTAYEPLELGAFIFVEANKNLQRAVNEFNLSLSRFDEEIDDIAIWDGENVLYTLSATKSWGSRILSWLHSVKFLLRYGYSSLRTQGLVKAMTAKIVTLYEPEAPTWSSIEELNASFNWTELVSQTGAEYFQSHGVSQTFAEEAIEAGTRVNYAQSIDSIHGLGATVSLATSGGVRVRGGNQQVFEQFVKRSGAQVFLKTKVVGIERQSANGWIIVTKDERRDYSAVVIAAPYHTSHISLPADLSSLIPPQPYAHVHITLLTTTASTPNPVYFGHKPGSKVATNVLATFGGVRHGGSPSEFNFISYQGRTKFAKNETHDEQETDEWIVKISSPERISDEWLATQFQNQVGWVLRKEWDAFPVLSPMTRFPPIKLDDGLFYINAFEPFISCMETETLASRNVVDLLLREKFNASVCAVEGERRRPGGFVYGWDC
ncbi:FAD/NAD(P)-binding domain-containing protein [Russula earlei]|uniref:FAD/NAD(P)-binding domain-containing protein n=1 Tax=Russula earlei TaxID=71964 RepID=A0ACC0UKY3_9AGAM|nr:FAD/NAD(P)-binding domain-containing protein [Russula earlei]